LKFFVPQAPGSHFFSRYLHQHPELLSSAEHADFLVLPFMYEVIYDYANWELEKVGVAQTDVIILALLLLNFLK